MYSFMYKAFWNRSFLRLDDGMYVAMRPSSKDENPLPDLLEVNALTQQKREQYK